MNLQEASRDLATAVVLLDAPSREATAELMTRLSEMLLSLDAKAPPAIARVVGRALQACNQELEAAQPQWSRAIAFVGEVADYCQLLLAHGGGSTAGKELVEPGADHEQQASRSDPELLASFLASSKQLLAQLEHLVLEMEAGSRSSEQLGAVRRIAHTLKGETGVLALHRAQELWHRTEERVERCIANNQALPVEALLAMIDWMGRYAIALQQDQDRALPPDDSTLEAVLQPMDSEVGNRLIVPRPEPVLVSVSSPAAQSPAAQSPAAQSPAAQSPAAQSPAAQSPAAQSPAAQSPAAAPEIQNEPVRFAAESLQDPTLPDFLTEGRAHLSAVEAALLEGTDQGASEDIIARIFRAFHTIKGVAAFLNLEPIVRLAHQTETLLDQFRKGQLTWSSACVDLVLAANDMMSRLFDLLTGQGAIGENELSTLVTRLESATAGRGLEPGNQVSAPTPTAGATHPERSPQPAIASAQAAPTEVKECVVAASANAEIVPAKSESSTRKQVKLDSMVSVNTLRLDALVDMVGELVIAQQVIAQDKDVLRAQSKSLQRNLTQVAKITRELQQSAMSLRMVTLKMTFQKMMRLARDVAAKSGKQVKVVVSGEDTELDRTVVEEIGDPLVHLIRNAIDHGLENTEDRLRAGKSPTGVLSLTAYHKGGSIVIEVKDDGRGLNRARIFAKARERGLIPTDQRLEDMSDEEIFKLIFLPGFSTAETVTSISGRGVGMDVVRRNIEALRGKIEIASVAGQGSLFTLRLPLTLAIIDGMVVRIGQRRYVIPTLAILQSFRPSAGQCHEVPRVGQMVEVRDQLIRVVRVDQALGTQELSTEGSEPVFVFVETHTARACLVVDEILGQQQVVIKNLGKAIPKIPSISGGAILGDGRVAPILDIEGILAAADSVASQATSTVSGL